MKQHVLVFVCVLLSGISYSQNFIKGIVTDTAQSPVPFCAMALVNSKDSSLVKGNVSDDHGEFMFEKLPAGNYCLRFTAIGFKELYSDAILIDSLSQIKLEPYVLKASGVNLKEVSVAVFKPIIEFKRGMVVMNVENSPVAGGNTVFDLLKRLPGVSIDAQNNILVNGKGGVRFLMDGRLQQIPSTQMVNLLMSMPADAVSVLELITNPPAKYDAAGSGGLINLVLKKAKVKGFSGSLAQSVSRGDNWRGGTFLNLNFKSNKLTFYSSINVSYLQFETKNYYLRKITDTSGTFEIVSHGNQLPFRKILFFNGGVEYALSKKTTIGINSTGNMADISNVEKSEIDFLSASMPSTTVNYNQVKFRNDTKSKVSNPTYNFNISHKIDSLTNLFFSTDFTNYTEDATRYNSSSYYNNDNVEVLPKNRFGSTIHDDFNIFTQKLDFDKQFKKGFTLEAGAKSSFVNNKAKSIIELTNPSTNDLYVDSNYSNSYSYKERILAGYATLGKTFLKKLDLTLGIRSEHTLINANNAPKPFTLHRDYINFFPSGSVDYRITDKHLIQASYSYRIGRPSYDQLNPARSFNDLYSNGAGNPYLKPEFRHSMAIGYGYNHFISCRIAHDEAKNNIYYYAYGNPNTKITVDSIFNFKKQSFTNFGVSGQKQFQWLNINCFADFVYRTNSTLVNGNAVNNVSYLYFLYGNLEFLLPKDIKFQVQANYNSKNNDGIQNYNPSGRVDLVLFKSFFDKKLDISISLFDAFYTDIRPYTNKVGGQYSFYTETNDTRRFRLWIMWKFGKMRISQNVKRSNDEEKGRLKSVN